MGRKLEAMRAAAAAKPPASKPKPAAPPPPVDTPPEPAAPVRDSAVPLINLPPAPKPRKELSESFPRLPDGSRFEMVFTLTGRDRGYWDGTLTVPGTDGPIVITLRRGGVHLMHARLSDCYWRLLRERRQQETAASHPTQQRLDSGTRGGGGAPTPSTPKAE